MALLGINQRIKKWYAYHLSGMVWYRSDGPPEGARLGKSPSVHDHGRKAKRKRAVASDDDDEWSDPTKILVSEISIELWREQSTRGAAAATSTPCGERPALRSRRCEFMCQIGESESKCVPAVFGIKDAYHTIPLFLKIIKTIKNTGIVPVNQPH